MEMILGRKSFRKETKNQSEIINAIMPPTSGARIIKLAVFIIGSLLIASHPPYATAAPAKPPIRVWDEDEGIPNHHVKRFQAIAAIKPEKMTIIPILPDTISSFTVLATVLATP